MRMESERTARVVVTIEWCDFSIHLRGMPGDGSPLRSQTRTPPGTRCIAGHGSSDRTLSSEGAIGSIYIKAPGGFTKRHLQPAQGSDEVECEVVLASLNKWLGDVCKKKEPFAPDRLIIVNCMRISNTFVRHVARAASFALLGRAESGTSRAMRGVLTEAGRKAMQCQCLHSGEPIDALWLWRAHNPLDGDAAGEGAVQARGREDDDDESSDDAPELFF
jgi:hypothetical protein